MSISSGIRWIQVKLVDRHGTGAYGQSSDGTGADGNLSKYNAGVLTDNGICYSYSTDSGTANAYAVTLSPAPTIVAGSTILLKVLHANTGASTLAVNGGATTAVKKESGSGLVDLAAGDWQAGQIAVVISDGTVWQWISGGSLFTSPLTTKGDIYTRSASADARLGVGSDGQILTADATQTDGIKWAYQGLTVGFVMNTGATGTNVGPMLAAPHAGTVSKCKIVTKASDGSTALTFTIKQNGTSVFSSNPTIAAGTASGTVSTSTSLTSSPLSIAADDVFTIDVTSGSSSWIFVAQLET